jgi:hypothetical protein
MRSTLIPPVLGLAVAFASAICAALGYLGISERQLTIGSRTGIHSAYGLSAVVEGWPFIGAALVFIGILASASRFKRLIWAALALAWAIAATLYFLWFY